ncbi:hypothetical protein NW768_007642 [Fusarium equiseti]|uniref:Aminotransferase class I/classII large domain-containing protein n=1 Tax=Fusarium equiseti TaxID=61235 RepID=A0ABQ8R897_FUSEQ|nr:hypothetical protein NW768_007642 [Fusarium equiseti]
MGTSEDRSRLSSQAVMPRGAKTWLDRLRGFMYSPLSATSSTALPGRGRMNTLECDQASNDYDLSERGAYNSCFRDVWGPREKLALCTWSDANPDGHTGPRVTSDDLFITPGLTSAIDSVVFAICNPGDGILIPEPFYNGFKIDITHRSDARIIGVTYDNLKGYSSLDDIFKPDMTRKALDGALQRAHRQGIKPRAVIISNVQPVETMREFMAFCGENDLHSISDEIYAKSVFQNPALTNKFTSALAIDWKDLVSPNRFHVLYSASKDFCANGLRIGVVYSQNKGLFRSMSSIGAFSWTPHLVQDIWAAMLEDENWKKELHRKNIRLMAQNYGIITCFMQKHQISYYEMNAGLYLWTDLRRFLVPALQRKNINLDDLRVGGPDDYTYKQREARFIEIGIKYGVLISPGTIYQVREYGWFRITFTAEQQMLQEGLRRLARLLLSHEVSYWC